MERWIGRVALVTGASAGIGAAICKILVESGLKVVGAARGVEKIQSLAVSLKGAKGSLTPIKCDLTKDEDIYNLFKEIKAKFGGVDVCINNAGLSHNKTLLDGTPTEWRHMIDVNVIALCLCSKLAVASMRERGVDDGHIININSTAGHRIPAFKEAHFYCGTKYAVKAISEGLRQEMRGLKSHIRVSSISPGMVETEFLPRMLKDPNATEMYKVWTPLQAKDIAETLLHVLSAPPHVEINEAIIRPTEQDS